MELINPLVESIRREALENPEQFWAAAADELHWFRKWDKTFDWDYPSFRWFVGGETNLAYNCLDLKVANDWGGHAALIYVTEGGERQVFTYAQMLHEVRRLAASLRAMGVGKGDRITIYMPPCPEAIMLMLAAVRIGAIHSVVFAGFGSGALGDRVQASGSRLVFATDVTYRRGSNVPLKGIVDASMEVGGDNVDNVIVLQRGDEPVSMTDGRDITWQDFLARGEGHDGGYEVMESNDPAFILATSGTTARPKLAVHVHGGYQVGIHSMGDWCFGLRPTDVWWSTSDIGWIVGHSYIVYAPLLAGATTIAFEGAIDHPGPDLLWKIIEEFGVTGLFTSPTAVRALMRYGDEPTRGADLSSLERVFCAGEALNAPAWEWLQKSVLEDRIPVIDHWWQTETGGPVIGNPYGISTLPIKPGSAGIPLPGVDVEVLTPEGEPVPTGEKGILTIKRPWPSLTPRLWGEPERYGKDYWGIIPERYFTGDSTSIDEDGYVWFAGRADEVIKIAAHRIGTVEVETAFLKHQAVAEAGVTGRPDELRGEVISAFVVLKNEYSPSNELRRELLQTVRRELGPIAVISELNFVDLLPKTRSGKIMRRVFKAVVLDQDPGDITTIEDEGSVEEARQAWEQMKAAMAREID